MTTKLTYPLLVMKWSTLQTEDGQRLKPGSAMRAVGYIPVYESEQDMVEDFGPDVPKDVFVPVITEE